MATSRTEICNRALLVLGEGAVINVGQDSQSARACELAYDPCLRSVLEQGDWSFATKRVDLGGRLVENPVFEFEFQYPLPNDFVRFQQLFARQRLQLDSRRYYSIEGGNLLTNFNPPLYLVYTFFQDDPRTYSELFAEALVYRIALYVQATLVESPTRQDYIEAKYDQQLRKALFNNANNQAPVIGFPSEVVRRKF